MADMGFMPQVQKILYGITATAPDDAVLGHARRRGRSASSTATMHDPVSHEVGSRTSPPSTRWTTVFLAVHQMDKVKVAAAIANARQPHA